MDFTEPSNTNISPLAGEIQGSLLLGMAQACLTLNIVAEREFEDLLRDVVPTGWYTVSRLQSFETIIRSYYDNPAVVLEQAGINFVTTWYQQAGGKEIVRSGLEFLQLQAGSRGYASVVRGDQAAVGCFDLLEVNESTGRAVIASTTPFSRDFERGVLLGGMRAPGDLDYVRVTPEADGRRFSILFRTAAVGKVSSIDIRLPEPDEWDPALHATAEISDRLYWHYMSTRDDERRVQAFAEATRQCLVRMACELNHTLVTQREMEDRLFKSRKLESLGTLAGGMAHDFNNVLHVIMGYASLLESLHTDSSQVQDATRRIISASARGTRLIEQLLAVARKTSFTHKPVQVNEIVGELATVLNETFPCTISINIQCAPDLPVITAEPTYLYQALYNLCLNAKDAMPTGGCLTIQTQSIDFTDLPAGVAAIKTSQYIMCSVTDTGTGMDRATAERIFDPFFTAKEAGKGTGMGLALVHCIVQGYGGFIDVESTVGKGSAFRVCLPVPDAPPASPAIHP